MHINKFNYEIYAQDYLDGALSDNLRQSMENFLQKHPEIREEFLLLETIVLEPDPSVVFSDKAVLKKSVAAKSNNKKTSVIFWASLAAAVIIGCLAMLKMLFPGSLFPENTPVAVEEKIQPIEKIEEKPKKTIHLLNPELIAEETVEEKTPFKSTQNQKTYQEIYKPGIKPPEKPVAKAQTVISTPKPLENSNPQKNEVAEVKSFSKTNKEQPEPDKIEIPVPTQDQEAVVVESPIETFENAIIPLNKSEEEPASVPDSEVTLTQDQNPSELAPPSNSEESLALVLAENEEPDQNLKAKNKKKKRVFFPKIKEKFSKANLSNALLPEAYSSGSDD